MYDSILFPYDGSENAEAILSHTGTIARTFDASVRVLYVATTGQDNLTVIEGQVATKLQEYGETVVQKGRETLETMNVDCDTEIEHGRPGPRIATYADENDFDLVVLPTRGETGLSKYILGSVTEKVVRLTQAPVLTARMDPSDELTFPYERILIPTDGSEAASAAVDHGLSLANALDASIEVLSVVDDRLEMTSHTPIIEEAGKQAAEQAVESVVKQAESRGIDTIDGFVEFGSPVDTILETVASQPIDAVVMGSTGKSRIDQILLGSVAKKAIGQVSVPVLTVPR